MAGAATLLPVRMETRFDRLDDGQLRLRVIVVPDRCSFDRHQGATDAELDLLERAVVAAGGALVPGTSVAEGSQAGNAFRSFAGQVGPGRAAWLAATFPPVSGPGGRWSIDRNGGGRAAGGRPTRISGLPSRLELHAVLSDGSRIEVETTEPLPVLAITPDDDDPDAWWPRWDELQRAGLAIEVVPCPFDPDTVDALYAIGVGETSAGELFSHHRDVGDLGLLAAGRPTNTVAGSPTGDLGKDPDAWRELTGRPRTSQEEMVSLALTGRRDQLGPMIGGTIDHGGGVACRCFIALLFPALAAHGLREVWGLSNDTVGEVGEWVSDFLRPDGPVRPVRVGVQPYAVWPVTAWPEWDAADGPSIEAALVPVALRARDVLAASVAERLGTVVGADERRLWELLAQTPTSSSYDVRFGIALGLLQRMVNGDPASDEWRRHLVESAGDVAGRQPLDPIVSMGRPWPTDLGLVLPRLGEDAAGTPLFAGPHPDTDGRDGAELLAVAPLEWVAQTCDWFLLLFQDNGIVDSDQVNAVLERLDWWPASLWWRLTLLSGLIAVDHALREEGPDPVGPLPDPSDPLLARVLAAPLGGSGGPADQWYRRWREALARLADLCRGADVDAGADLLALMERTLRGLLDTAAHRVDPWLTGAAWRRLVALEGEDRPLGLYGWLDGPFVGVPGPDLDTGLLLAPSVGQARLAAVLRDKARRDPERRWDLDITSAGVRDALRLADDVRAGAHPAEAVGREVERLIGTRLVIDAVREAFPVRPEHAGRRTCDGVAVLDAARDPADTRLAALGVPATAIAAIATLDRTIDVHGDLLVVEAVHHALDGRPEAAAHALDAAAGLQVPPDLAALATPSRGRSVRTSVLTVLPAVTSDRAERSPVVIASPAVAAWLADGDPDGPAWTWSVGGTAVTLAALGLVPADALAIDAMGEVARFAVGAPAGTPVTEPTGPAAVRRRIGVIGARPPAGSDLGLDPADADMFDRAAARSLRRRLAATRLAARRARWRLQAATTDDARVRALVGAARWSVVPPVPDADGTVDLAAAAEAARAELTARIGAVPAVPATVPGPIVAALLALVGTTVPVTLDVTVPVGPLVVEPLTELDGRSRLDREWLEVVAGVRPALAFLDAHQHEAVTAGRAPFVAATSHPGTPWLPAPPARDHTVPHLVVAYGPAPLAITAGGAWSVVDTFAETVPTNERTAGVAMRFNAPGAQAPNAILVAVAPSPGGEVSTEVALAAVVQARATARARMARPEDLGPLDPLAGPWVPAFEDGGLQYTAPADREHWR